MQEAQPTGFYLILFLFILSLLIRLTGKNTSKSASKREPSNFVAVKTRKASVDNKDSLKTCISQMSAISSVEEAGFLLETYFREKYQGIGDISAAYISIYKELCKEYEIEITNCLKDSLETVKYYEKQLRELQEECVAEEFEEEEEYQFKSLKEDHNEEVKAGKKILKWYKRELDKVKKDQSALIRKFVACTNRETKEAGFFVIPNSLWELDLPKEPPNSIL